MKKLLSVFIIFSGIFLFSGINNTTFAASCADFGITASGSVFTKQTYQVDDPSNEINFSLSNVANDEYDVEFRATLNADNTYQTILTDTFTGSGGTASYSNSNNKLFQPGSYKIIISGTGISNFLGFTSECELASYSSIGAKCDQVSVYQKRPSEAPQCFGGSGGGCLDATNDIWIDSKILYGYNNENFLTTIIQDIKPGGSKQGTPNAGVLSKNHGNFNPGNYSVYVRQDGWGLGNSELCKLNFTVSINCDSQPEEIRCVSEEPVFSEKNLTQNIENFSLCKQIPESQQQQRAECVKCIGGDIDNEENKGVWTALGCIQREPESILTRFISIGLGMGGGVALITFLAAGFIYSTSQGDPKAYGKANEMMTAAITGLIFIIFSVTILQFIGFEILKIPGFGG